MEGTKEETEDRKVLFENHGRKCIKNELKEMLEKVAVSPEEEDIIDEALHLLEGYTDPPYPILAAYWGNLSEKHKPKALYLLQGAG